MSANLKNSAVAAGLKIVTFHFSPREGQGKEYSSYHTIAFISHVSKVMPQILQACIQQYVK